MDDTGKKILVIDDREEIVKMLTDLLPKHGYAVVSVLDANNALVTAQQQQPDLILLDIAMPKMDGFVIGSKLRHDDTTKHIPILMVTAHAEQEDKERAAKDIGDVEFIPKPFRFEVLLEKINRILGVSE